jgi:NAD(P)-dependent dehydrogenase (short-subunit alcohol dehydrogenase family)
MNTFPDLDGKTIMITGATDGLGKQTALQLANLGARIILHGRNLEKANRVAQEIRDLTSNPQVEVIIADLQSLKQVRSLADAVKQRTQELHVLINNAGIYLNQHHLSEDGYEMTFAVNHLAPFLLTNLLLDLLKQSAPSRIVIVSSVGHKFVYLNPMDLEGKRFFWSWVAYCRSKLLNILFTFELDRHLKGSGVTANAIHPGVIRATNLTKAARITWGITHEQGAQSIVHLAASPEVEGISGKYFDRQKISTPSSIAYQEKLQKKLWDLSLTLTGLKQDRSKASL